MHLLQILHLAPLAARESARAGSLAAPTGFSPPKIAVGLRHDGVVVHAARRRQDHLVRPVMLADEAASDPSRVKADTRSAGPRMVRPKGWSG